MPNIQLLTLQSNGASNTGVFVDNSRFNNIITRNGNVTNGAFNPYGDNWSVYFNGSSSLSITPTSSLNLGNTYTYEMWAMIPTGTSNKQLLGGGSTKMLIGTGGSSSTVGVLRFYDGSSVYLGDSAYLIANDKWNHIAVVRESTGTNGFKMYVNGILVYVGTNSSGLATPPAYTIGGYNSSTDLITGYISNLRISSTAIYTTSSTTIGTQVFTPSTTPLNANANTLFLACRSNKFEDLSPLNYAVTVNSSPAIQKFSPFGTVTVPKYYSTYFNGSSDYLTVPAASTAFGTNPWTIECWVYLTSLAAVTVVFDTRSGTSPNNGVQCSVGTDGSVTWFEGSGSTIAVSSAGVITTNAWYHIAFVRSSTTTNGCAIYINGTSVKTGTSNLSHAGYITYIGRNAAAVQNYPTGYISNFRVVNGSAVVPPSGGPTAPVSAVANTSLLTCQNNTFIDNSLNNFTITNGTTTVKPLPVSPFTPTANTGLIYSPTVFSGSMYFDGTGDYLSTPYNAAHDLVASDFTIEMWVYRNATGEQYLVHQRPTVTSAGWALEIYTGNQLRFYYTGSTTVLGTNTIPINSWNHIAVTRSGTAVKFYINGIADTVTPTTVSNGTSSGTTLYIGTDNTPGSVNFNGYISDLKINKGVSFYNGNFYPGSSPSTSIGYINNRTDLANTAQASLLLNGTTTGIIDQTRTVNLESFGDAKVVQGVSPYNGNYYSNYFDGTGDWLTFTGGTPFNFGSGDFTIEAWVNAQSFGNSGLVFFSNFVPNSVRMILYLSSTGVGVDSGSLITFSGTTTCALNTWYHCAFVRVGNSFNTFINGVQVSTATYSSAYWVTAGTNVTVGDYSDDYSTGYGYVSNVRVIKGQALYTGTFTPATVPLTSTAVGSTGSGAASSITGTVSLLTCQSNKFIDNSPNAAIPTVSGNSAVKTQNPFQVNSGQSYYFDGTGDYLYSSSSTILNGDFTCETWINPTAVTGPYIIFHFGTETTNRYQLILTGGQLSTNLFGAISTTYAGTITAGVWTHVAMVKSSGVISVYINGVKSATTEVSSTNIGNGPLYIGSALGTGQ